MVRRGAQDSSNESNTGRDDRFPAVTGPPSNTTTALTHECSAATDDGNSVPQIPNFPFLLNVQPSAFFYLTKRLALSDG